MTENILTLKRHGDIVRIQKVIGQKKKPIAEI